VITVAFLAAVKILSLGDALVAARTRPSLTQARAGTLAAWARANEARAALLPQVNGSAAYQRRTGNFAQQPGSIPSMNAVNTPSSFDTYNYFSLGLQVNQLLYDSQQSIDRLRSARVSAESTRAAERQAVVAAALDVRASYFAARAQRALVEVAKESLALEEKHLAQVEGFVRIGTHPEIDLAQSRLQRANARVQLVQSEANYDQAKAQLNLSMGRPGPTDYDVADDTVPLIGGEDGPLEAELSEAESARADLSSLDRAVRAQELTVSSTKGGYGPSVNAVMGLTYAGTDPAKLVWNWTAQLQLGWTLFGGLSTFESVKEQEANLVIAKSQRDQLKMQVRLDLERARLAVRGAKAALVASDDALFNGKERLRLAEGRYSAGVGNAIEVGDARLALTQAAAQRVQSEYNLATARAQLLAALGRD